MKLLLLFFIIFNSLLFSEQNNNKCKLFNSTGIKNLKYECSVEKKTSGWFFDEVDKKIISGRFINLDKRLYVTDGECKDVDFEIENIYLDYQIKKCNLVYNNNNYPLKVNNNNINLVEMIQSTKNHIEKSKLYIQDYKDLSFILQFKEKIGEFNILVDKEYETYISKIYQRRFDQLPEWKKILVFYNKRFDYINIKKKFLTIDNIEGEIKNMDVVGLIKNNNEKELVLFYTKNKDNLKINFDFNNYLSLNKLYKSIDYQQIEFDYQLEKLKLNKLKGYYKNVKRVTFRNMNLIKNKSEFNKHNNFELMQWTLRLITESLNEFDYTLKPTEKIIVKIYKMD